MPQFVQCFVLEWSWWFLALLVTGALALVVLVGGLIWFFGFRYWRDQKGQESTEFTYEGATIKSKGTGVTLPKTAVSVVAILVVVGGAFYLLGKAYQEYGQAFGTGFDSPSIEVDMEKVREKLQHETTVTILVSDAARKVRVKGSYPGACAAVVLDSICRQYASQLSCQKSWYHGTLSVDVAKPK